MVTTTVNTSGRLGNQIIRNIFISIIAKNNNLKVLYHNTNAYNANKPYYNDQLRLGIELFSGSNDYDTYIRLDDNNVLYYTTQLISSNLAFNGEVYFQTQECSNYLYNYIRNTLKNNIIEKNMFKSRYNNNDDTFVHVRLGDVISYNPGFAYYDKALSQLNSNNIYIATDSPDHSIIKELVEKYKAQIVDYDEVNTIHFGSTCKNIVLSHGSFSAIIGYFSFYSAIYYPEYNKEKIWYGDMFSIPGWNKISYIT